MLCLIVSFFLLLAAYKSNGQIVINEIGIGAPCPNFFNCSDAGGGGEFIELFKSFSIKVDVHKTSVAMFWFIVGQTAQDGQLQFPTVLRLAQDNII
jgi:hypothetical protein